MPNSLSFCLSVKLLTSPYLNEILAGYSILGCRLFSFITLSMFCHSLLAWRVSIKRSAVILMGIPFVCYLLFFPCLKAARGIILMSSFSPSQDLKQKSKGGKVDFWAHTSLSGLSSCVLSHHVLCHLRNRWYPLQFKVHLSSLDYLNDKLSLLLLTINISVSPLANFC